MLSLLKYWNEFLGPITCVDNFCKAKFSRLETPEIKWDHVKFISE